MYFNKLVNTIWLDMDGVLADFDKSARRLFGMKPEDFERLHGPDKFWDLIKSEPDFFLKLEPMPDMKELYNYTKKYNPPILTGIPKALEEQYGNQKIEWSRKKFGEKQKIFLTRASKKHMFCKPGDILIDDRTKYKHLWENAGGLYIVHKSAKETIKALKRIGL